MSQAQSIVDALGGFDNIVEIEPCITRLRCELEDGSLVDEPALKAPERTVSSSSATSCRSWSAPTRTPSRRTSRTCGEPDRPVAGIRRRRRSQ